MSMLTTLAAIKKTLSTRNWPGYEQARVRNPALAEYATPEELHAAVRPGSPVPARERERLVAALVEENQLAPNPLWQSLLFVAFEPLLLEQRSTPRVRGMDDADAEVLAAFADAVRSVRAGAYTTLALRWVTEAKLARRPTPQTEEYEDERHGLQSAEAGADAKVDAADLLAMLEARAGREVAEAIVATEIGGETLKEYVDRVHGALRAEARERVYVRLVRARNEALYRLRARVDRKVARAA